VVEFSARNPRQFVTVEDNVIKLWSFDGNVIRPPFRSDAPIKAISLGSADGNWITAATAGSGLHKAMIQIWDIQTGTMVRNFTRTPFPGSSFWCVSWNQNGSLLAACLDQSVLILNTNISVISTISIPNKDDFIISADWSKDGNFIAFGSYFGLVTTHTLNRKGVNGQLQPRIWVEAKGTQLKIRCRA